MQFPTLTTIKKQALTPLKKYGQNFLIDQNIARKTIEHLRLSETDTVIEIGSGFGSLTFFLLQTGAVLYCIELDKRLYRILQTEMPNGTGATLFNQDFLDLRISQVTGSTGKAVLVGNIPYSITSPVFWKLLSESSHVRRALFIVQHEVANRICAAPGSKDYGALSVFCSTYLETSYLWSISPECFYPVPKVTSAAIECVPHVSRHWNDAHEIFFRMVVKSSFSQRRKTLYNSLKPLLSQNGIDASRCAALARANGIDMSLRAENLSPDDFCSLAHVIQQCRPSL